MIGQKVKHYRIDAELGKGGMGTVYRARDTHLDRDVALKFLPQHLSTDAETKSRFIHEAKAASSLDHPNICTIYDIEEADDGQLFIAMAYYEGQTLKERLEDGPLPTEEAVHVARQIASALRRAHNAGMVHRDIKPANIALTGDGLVKLLDFGIAKLAGATVLTREGSTIGTVHYMSPEQARGEAVDARSDLWSLGAVLFRSRCGS
jgi:serine/threonine protein kinase